MTDLSHLEEIARAATPGEWKAVGSSVKVGRYNICPSVTAGGSGITMQLQIDGERANAAHIAAFSPPVALAMLAVCKAARDFTEREIELGWGPSDPDLASALKSLEGLKP